MRNRSKLVVLTICFNNELEIEDFLFCLNRQKIPDDLGEKINCLFIDNNSSDKTIEKILSLRQFLPKLMINVKKNPYNMGFAKAVNLGFRSSAADWFLLINPDVQLSNENSLRALLTCASNHAASIIGGLLFDKTKTIQNTAFTAPSFFTGIFEFTNIKKLWLDNPFFKKFYYLNRGFPFSVPTFVDGVSAGFMLIDNRLLKLVKFFDERFFLYLEDVDFCIRARRIGAKILFCPAARGIHLGGASSKNKRGKIDYKAWVDSRSYFFKKHFTLWKNSFIQLIFLADRFVVWSIHAIRNIGSILVKNNFKH